jgi:hypothetical protein
LGDHGALSGVGRRKSKGGTHYRRPRESGDP